MFQFPGSFLPGAASFFKIDKIQAARAFMIVGLVFLCPGLSWGDVDEAPDTTAEDLGGAVLLVSNIAVSFYLGHELKAGRSSTGRGFLGVGLGATSVVLGILEETDRNFDLSRSISVSPLVLQTERDHIGLGLLMSAGF